MFSRTVVIKIGNKSYTVDVPCMPSTRYSIVLESAHKIVMKQIKKEEEKKLKISISRLLKQEHY